jgi:RNA polymerase sigma factor (sigma-70 family)
MTHPDQRYIEALAANNYPLINEIYQRFAPRISRLVVQNSGTETDAADIFQDALLMIYRRCKDGDFTLTCPLEAFLYLVCRNKWINELQKRKNRHVTIKGEGGFDISDDAAGACQEFMLKEQRQQLVQETLQLLDEGCRQLLQLAWQGKQLQDIAQTLNFTYAYVRKKKSSCMSKLVALVRSSNQYHALQW